MHIFSIASQSESRDSLLKNKINKSVILISGIIRLFTLFYLFLNILLFFFFQSKTHESDEKTNNIDKMFFALEKAIVNNDVESLEKLRITGTTLSSSRALIEAINQRNGALIKCNLPVNDKAPSSSTNNIEAKYNKIVEFLLNLGADPNIVVDTHLGISTIFSFACRAASVDIVEAMIRRGANLTSMDGWRRTPIEVAFAYGRYNTVKLFLQRREIITTAGEEINRMGLLHSACAFETGSMEIVEKLLYLGADVNSTNQRGASVLDCACYSGNFELVELLINRGASVKNRESELFRNAVIGKSGKNLDVVKCLLDIGADINVEKNGMTAMTLALEVNHREGPYHDEVCRVLIRHIAYLKSRNLFVSNLNLDAARESRQNKKFTGYYDECARELRLLRNEQFDDSSLFYWDMLNIKNCGKLSTLASNENIVGVLKSDDFSRKFPIYGQLIVKQIDRGIERNNDFNFVKRFVNYLSNRQSNRLPKLPFTFVCDLFAYLSEKDIVTLRNI